MAPPNPTAAPSSFKKKKQKKGAATEQNPSVAEATRIRISRILQEFRTSNNEVYTFEENLTNFERAAVHMLCKKMGMRSKSSGRGNQRRISVYKFKKNEDTRTGKEDLTSFRFSNEANEVLQDLFTQYPPNDCDVGEEMVGEPSGKTDKLQKKKDDTFFKPLLNRAEIAKKVESLASRVEKAPNLRQGLDIPFHAFVQVVLISGETGCGKTTQDPVHYVEVFRGFVAWKLPRKVPQYILDYMWGKGEACKIVCTQPRRISATSVAERISSERGENVGDSVGYKIRLESKGGRHSSIIFCANGVLLRVLVTKGSGRVKTGVSKGREMGDVYGITHIIVGMTGIHQKMKQHGNTLFKTASQKVGVVVPAYGLSETYVPCQGLT
ncbi:hypothetical protein RJ639_026089 [Escallonia herrerae]|uniref:R3H domain-containing protein n=1 Tax=Escallonia herrerae TaxID=1293975 RepID=A0AA88SC46_9ASTE|nr:hypothetical protein RJ639_026089 [Escallonia herrerae]